jgi:transposase
MKCISTLSDQERCALLQVRKISTCHRERERAHAVLLSAKGYSLDQLADIFEADRDTISRWLDDWLDDWQAKGVDGLPDAPRPGRPSKLDDRARQLIEQAAQAPTPNLKSVLHTRLKKGVIS